MTLSSGLSDKSEEDWSLEYRSGRRFGFGRNWEAYLAHVDEDRVLSAENSLKDMLGIERLEGKTFLDIGSGSGLFSLAARRLGASVRSFDYDPASVGCAIELKRRYAIGDDHWRIQRGSVLDRSFVEALGVFDIVYSWGVLHHTGAMWQALDNTIEKVRPGGLLFVAIYNDQGRSSTIWKWVKRTYVRAPAFLRWAILLPAFARLWGPTMFKDALHGNPFRSWSSYASRPGSRGMHPWRDLVDWVGGYPFEVATCEQLVNFCATHGLDVVTIKDCGTGLGCNELVFERRSGRGD